MGRRVEGRGGGDCGWMPGVGAGGVAGLGVVDGGAGGGCLCRICSLAWQALVTNSAKVKQSSSKPNI